MIYFKYLIKTILSNISPNKSIFNVVVVCIRTFLLNLKYSFKNFYKLPSKIYSDDISYDINTGLVCEINQSIHL